MQPRIIDTRVINTPRKNDARDDDEAEDFTDTKQTARRIGDFSSAVFRNVPSSSEDRKFHAAH